MKRVLIISPHFPPINAADIHRVRHSLPYFKEFGWDPVVMAVDPNRVEGFRDELLLDTVPSDVRVEHVSALDYHWTRLFGLGSLALRSLPFYRTAVNRMLRNGAIDLIYFSTTMFPVLALGPYWKRRFHVPFVVDMQDPWHSDYYQTRPRHERPPKYWFAYRMNKLMEPRTLSHADGLIAVSEAYIRTLRGRYPALQSVPAIELPFGASRSDSDVAATLEATRGGYSDNELVGTYTGVCNSAMVPALDLILETLARGREESPELFGRVRLRFIGTSYATDDRARPVVMPIAERHNVAEVVSEQTARVPYFEALKMQTDSDFLLLPGTLDGSYTASKLYPYIMSKRPILALFRGSSSVTEILDQTRAGKVVEFDKGNRTSIVNNLLDAWKSMLQRLPYSPPTDWAAFEPYTAREMTRRQVEVFNQVTEGQ